MRVAPAIIAALFPAALFVLALVADGIKAVSPRLLHRPEVPFAEVPRGVALLFQQLDDRSQIHRRDAHLQDLAVATQTNYGTWPAATQL